jgi:glycerophosphoryl diester phosphodiesterase
MRHFIIDSHRGAFKNGLVENTEPAFEESYLEGANCVECDIRKTKDNQIVLLHNSTIDHICKLATKVPEISEFNEEPIGKVSDHTLTYLKALQFPNNAQLLTLAEFLKVLDKYKLGCQIELKEGGYEDLILKEIESANLDYKSHSAPVVCTSFNYFAVKQLVKKAKNYKIPLYTHQGGVGLAFGFQGIALGSFYGKYMLRQFHKLNIWGGMTFYKYMPAERLEYAHKLGVHFCPRVPNTKELVMKYIQAGVDGFETDSIQFIRSCIDEAGYQLPKLPTKLN